MKINLNKRFSSLIVLLLLGGSYSFGQSILKGTLLTDGEITIGASIVLDETVKGRITQINGEFEIEKPKGKDFKLQINPCCTCYVLTTIAVKKEAIELEINCNCKKSRVFVIQKLDINGEIVEEKSKFKFGN
jgi:hypothetical protein